MSDVKIKRRTVTELTGAAGELRIVKDSNPKTPGVIKVYVELRKKKADGKTETTKGASSTVTTYELAQTAVANLLAEAIKKQWVLKVKKSKGKPDVFDINSIPVANASAPAAKK